MRRSLACLPLALLFIANVVPAKAQKTEGAEGAEGAGGAGGAGGEETVVRVREGAPLELQCALRVEQRAAWRREGAGGAALPAGLRPAAEAPAGPDGALTARLRAAAARPQHAGVYACARGPRAMRLRVVVEPAAAAAAAAAASASAAPAAAPAAPPAAAAEPEPADDTDIYYFDLGRANNISLHCNLDNPTKLPYVWSVNGTALEEAGGLRGRYKLEQGGALFVLEARALEDDFGNYSCALGAAGEGAAARAWAVHARPLAKLPANTNVVEGQKLKLVCKVLGKPAPAVQWRYSNDSADAPAGGVDVEAALGGRARINDSDAGVPGAVLVLDAAQRGDAGSYTCRPLVPPAGRAALPDATTVLRVKDMYAALWPFLGICAEVLVLCVVILVYEKRRAKPELDDSDTDNHDQKKS